MIVIVHASILARRTFHSLENPFSVEFKHVQTMAAEQQSLCLKITLVRSNTKLSAPAPDVAYPSKLMVALDRDRSIADLSRRIERNVASMGFHSLRVAHIATNDLFRLPPHMRIADIAAAHSELIATYSVHFAANADHARDADGADELGAIGSVAPCRA